ncbi:alpha-1,3-rhamnosyltransferase [Natronincola peptidivorans]|uniref:Alpha-1,3-rhamnosyltransferase n=1 Tax=Natronincola peptidivorans TaxID=426128 RepID=A0A1H9ZSX2_9FIRM|nr:glycosyltransferase family 2 protein [Natronincola peptidivorans]SES84796.1 alpha-1,3-rhamnosyltransferase [Natronincola peptidivorans]
MYKPLVSLITPAYNHEKYISQYLESIIAQTYKNIELIILNDGSIDNTHNKILEYKNKLEQRFIRFAYINKENEGIPITLNKALNIAKGKYIRLFASDDVMIPQTIEKQVNYLESNDDIGIVYSDGYHVKTDNLSQMKDIYDPKRKFSNIVKYPEGDLYEFFMHSYFGIPTCTFMIRKECLDFIGGFDEKLAAESFDMSVRLSMHFKFGLIKEALVYHRVHENNTGWDHNLFKLNTEQLIEKYTNYKFKKPSDNKVMITKLTKLLFLRGVFDKNRINSMTLNKRVVGWGAGDAYLKFKDIYNLNCSYLIDIDTKKQNTQIDGKRIYAPKKLLEESKEDIFILVMTQRYKEVYSCLEEYGFEYLTHFF